MPHIEVDTNDGSLAEARGVVLLDALVLQAAGVRQPPALGIPPQQATERAPVPVQIQCLRTHTYHLQQNTGN